MATHRLTRFLESNHVPYRSVPHRPAFTAQEVAASAGISGKRIAKTVVVNADGELILVVLPACERLDLEEVKEDLGAEHAELANESEFIHLFPDTEIGAMPPFGNLYGLRVFVTSALGNSGEITFNAGSHQEAISMAYQHFHNLVRPVQLGGSHRNN